LHIPLQKDMPCILFPYITTSQVNGVPSVVKPFTAAVSLPFRFPTFYRDILCDLWLKSICCVFQ
jgi:hypothetical protein